MAKGKVVAAQSLQLETSHILIPSQEADDLINENETVISTSSRSNRTFNKFAREKSKILKRLKNEGWASGYFLPFANKENQNLEKSLELKQVALLTLKDEVQDNVNHIESINEHLNRTTEGIEAYRIVIEDKGRQVEHHKNFFCLGERYLSKLKQDIDIGTRNLKNLMRRNSSHEAEKKIRRRRQDEMEKLLLLDEQIISSYRKKLDEFDDEIANIKYISEIDGRRGEEMRDALLTLGAQRKSLMIELDQEGRQTSKAQEQFHRLSVEFRKLHVQRLEMVEMWSATIKAMKTKDNDMQALGTSFFQAREALRKTRGRIMGKENLIGQKELGIKIATLGLADVDRKLAALRIAVNQERELLMAMRNAVSVCENQIFSSSSNCKAVQTKMQNIEDQLKEMKQKIITGEELKKKLQQKHATISVRRRTSVVGVQDLERELEDQERKRDELTQEMKSTRQFHWEKTNENVEINKEISLIDASVNRLKQNIFNIENKEFSNMEFLAKQASDIYKLDLDASSLDLRIQRSLEGSKDSELHVLESKRSELKDVVKKLADQNKHLTHEYNIATDFCRRYCNDINAYLSEQETLESEEKTTDVLIKRFERMTKECRRKLQDFQVEKSILGVDLKNIQEKMASENSAMFSLNDSYNTTKYAVLERRNELEFHKTLKTSKLRALQEAVRKMRTQFTELKRRHIKLKGKFEMLSLIMSGSSDSSAEERSFSYQIKKAARARQALMAEKSLWEGKTEEAELEVKGLLQAKSIMGVSNEEFRLTLLPAEETSERIEELVALDQFKKNLVSRRASASKIRTLLNERTLDLQQSIEFVGQHIQSLGHVRDLKNSLASKSDMELNTQSEKIRRWNLLNTKLVRSLKPVVSEKELQKLEKDLKLRFTMEKLQLAISTIEKVVGEHPQTKQTILNFLTRHNCLADISRRIQSKFHQSKIKGRSGFARAQFDYEASLHMEIPRELLLDEKVSNLQPRSNFSNIFKG